jgi:hypothetical protein
MSSKHGSTSHQRAGGVSGTVSPIFCLSPRSTLLVLVSTFFDHTNREGTGNAIDGADRYVASASSLSIGVAKRYFRVDISIYVYVQIIIVSYLLYRTVAPDAFDVTTIKYTLMLLAQV